LGIVTAVVVISALYFARIVFIPLALAILVAIVLTPVVSLLETRLRLRRALAIVVVIGTLVALAAGVAWIVLPQFVNLTYQLPEYEKAIQDKIENLKSRTAVGISSASESMKALENEIATKSAPANSADGTKTKAAPGTSASRPLAVEMVPPATLLQSLASVIEPLATIVVVLVFAVFMLAGRENLRNRVIRLMSGGRLTVMTQAMDDALQRINRYLFMQMLMNALYGTVIWIALHFIGIPNAALWGLCAAVLRYLPYIGWPMAALLPVGLALAVFPGWFHAILTGCVFVALELLQSNFIEPLVYGANIGLAPLAILVAAVFWTLIWGFPGLLLSTPMTVCLMVVGRYVPSLGFLSILLGNEPVMEPAAQYYQRLLAGDQVEARQILETYLKGRSLEELYDSVVIPALGRSEQDGHLNELDDETRTFINSSTREIAEEISGTYPAAAGDTTHDAPQRGQGTVEGPGHVDVLCIPARDEADDVVAALLAQVLERNGVRSASVAIGSMAETITQVSESNPGTVCISALPPLAMNHTRTLYAELRARSPELQIIVCLWHLEGDLQRAASPLRLSSRDQLFGTLRDVLRHFAGQETSAPAEVSPAVSQ
jgi:predicted PurR-regulated permease PerM